MDGKNNKIGYLHDDFKFFHITDNNKLDFDYHHHDFSKIVILLDGDLTYIVEGKNYVLKPWDILLVGENQIHKPVITSDKPYERIIFWLRPDDDRLLECFYAAIKNKHNLLRLPMDQIEVIKSLLNEIKNCQGSDEFCSDILSESLFLQFMIIINRLFLSGDYSINSEDIQYDKTIEKVLDFINDNLDQELSIDIIANECFISKYYLMRKFKAHMGNSIHNYIVKKRLVLAKELILKGYSMNEVCARSGFNDYSTFVRGFKKCYGVSPSQYNPKSSGFDNGIGYE